MSLYKRKKGTIYWCNYTKPNGERVRESTGTTVKELAEEFEAARKHAAWQIYRLGKPQRYTWEEAVVAYLSEKHQAKSIATVRTHLRWIDPHLAGKYIDEIDGAVLARLRTKKGVYEKNEKGHEVVTNPATVNRVMEVVSAVLRHALKLDWLKNVPPIPMWKEPKGRLRWLTVEQAARLLQELPEHQRAIALFDLNTGLRSANVRLLEWDWVDLERAVAVFPAAVMKSNIDHAVPLNQYAMQVLSLQTGMHPKYVFPYRDKPVGKLSTKAWREAIKRAGIKDFRPHDLRHTWASWLVQGGSSIQAVMQLGGWSSLDMVMRYAHLSQEHLAKDVAKLPNLFAKMVEVGAGEQA